MVARVRLVKRPGRICPTEDRAEVRGDRKNRTAVVTISGFVNARWFFRHHGRFLSKDYVIRSRPGQVPTCSI
ncbi:hypothetical protein PEX1_057250 [Penicillium expansum]|uniref:Uncharacterized protein n=1 Tax=Penicillium expansum TaxID=27334 RepID=A0A0A2KSF5_PENEN|nr:hypothetical protein PEX2_005000 [Penicillium expansum]KGO39490.1 hypothetical protein PEXP_043310 [Penicillium expansum]KGO55740.1 hypothetical protein PEX2_005000 [Penicillium expansum]KGO70767.1 hypothetical protein PEX1_057250 [Penicillium expansum]